MNGHAKTLKTSFDYQQVVQEEKRLTEFMENQETIIDWTGVAEDTQYFTHGLHPYPARMAPHISRRLLRLYSRSRTDLLLDPYCGSGGVLVEGMLYDRFSVGVDLNPLAVLIARVKTTPVEVSRLEKARSAILSEVKSERDTDRSYQVPPIRNVTFWFKPEAIQGLSKIKGKLELLRDDPQVYDFFRVCFSLTVRRSSNVRNGEFKLYRRQGEQLLRFKPDPVKYFAEITHSNIAKMREFAEEMKKHPLGRAVVRLGDTRKLLEVDPEVLKEKSVNIVITSPPYGDSHTTVAYGQFSRYSSLWLGFPEEEVLAVDKRGLGGRLVRKEQNPTSPTLDAIISEIGKIDERRAKEVLAYFYDADLCLEQLAKSMIPHRSHCCYVLANRTVKRVRIPTDVIFVELAKKYGLGHVTTIYREIPNKYIPYRNAPENISGKLGSTMSRESIVIWKY